MMSMDCRKIIMNYTIAPSLEDLEVISRSLLDSLPDEILRFCENLEVVVEEMVDELTEQELELDDPFELLTLYKNGKEIAPGIEKKNADGEDVLLVFRRPLLDVWCETGDDLSFLIRQVMIEELGRNFDFSEEEIAEMAERHYQGML